MFYHGQYHVAIENHMALKAAESPLYPKRELPAVYGTRMLTVFTMVNG
jgi:hypothetical protein